MMALLSKEEMVAVMWRFAEEASEAEIEELDQAKRFEIIARAQLKKTIAEIEAIQDEFLDDDDFRRNVLLMVAMAKKEIA